ncbi:MAG: hypothetical protein OEU46_16790, partial [Alphaproteobacteria bacterium]|nr:hypothetical protein [Alphaproteobacteria bacterium]
DREKIKGKNHASPRHSVAGRRVLGHAGRFGFDAGLGAVQLHALQLRTWKMQHVQTRPGSAVREGAGRLYP